MNVDLVTATEPATVPFHPAMVADQVTFEMRSAPMAKYPRGFGGQVSRSQLGVRSFISLVDCSQMSCGDGQIAYTLSRISERDGAGGVTCERQFG